MRDYKESITKFAYEIADDITRKEANPNWTITFYKDSVAKRLSLLFDKNILRVTKDLEKSMGDAFIKIRDKKLI